MGANDGAVLAFRQLVNNGANNLRYNIVLVAEGYTAAEMPLFRTQCQSFLRTLFWSAPFDTLRCTFNVFALEVSSSTSGTDDPATCGDGSTGSGAMPATYFDSTVCGGGRIRRLMGVDGGAVMNRVAGFLPQVHSILVLVNSPLFGGAGGNIAVFTTNPGWEDTALHEFGHVLGLADEYSCYVCDGTDSGRTYDWFDSIIKGYGLPTEPNVSDTSARASLKWASSVASTTPLPTPPGSLPAGTVGAFAGARYYGLGLFRAEENCRMRSSGVPFCAVCRAAIVSYMAPWTPSTACVSPTANPPTLTLNAQVSRKVVFTAGRGGYEATLAVSTDLTGAPALRWRLDAGAWTPIPTPPAILVPINRSGSTYVYNHTVEVEGVVTVADLDYWVPGNSTFTTATGARTIALLQPNNAANRLVTDYDNAGNTEGNGSVAISFGRIAAGNGWLYVRQRKYYTRIAVRLQLHAGFFGPDDDAAWVPQTITWTPAPSQSAGLTAFYDVTFDAAGLCYLTSDPANVVDPNVGFQISATGKDAIGQPFSATATLRPTNVEYTRSVSTIEVPRIPQWEWPMRFDIREKVVDVVFDGVRVTLKETELRIGDVRVKIEQARPG